MAKINKKKAPSIIEETLKRKREEEPTKKENFKVSFQYLDSSQKYGSSYKDWQKAGLLSKMLEVLQGYCCRPLREQIDGDKFTIYGDFPPKDKTLFQVPKSIPEDAEWARIHVNGKAIIAGHLVKETFYVVFLDKSHRFWLTKRVTSN